MRLVVTDTSVFIDLMEVGGVTPFFALAYEVHTTVFVVDELNAEQQSLLLPFIAREALIVDQFDGDTLTLVEAMETRAGLSFTDRSVLHLALLLKATLLSGDGGIRKECVSRQIQFHGSIWVIEQLWKRGLLGPVPAITCLEYLKEHNLRLPKAEILALMEKIRKG